MVTSGLGGRFPPGYPVATVTDVKRTEGKAFIDIQATPNAKLDHTREVLLVWTLRTPALDDTENTDPVTTEELPQEEQQ